MFSRKNHSPEKGAPASPSGVGSCLAPPPASAGRIVTLAPPDGHRAFVAYLAPLGFELYGPSGSPPEKVAPAFGGGALAGLTPGTPCACRNLRIFDYNPSDILRIGKNINFVRTAENGLNLNLTLWVLLIRG